MLKSCEAIYERGQLRWLKQSPQIPEGTRMIVVFEEGAEPMPAKSREDLQSVLQESWGAWGAGKTMDKIDQEIEEMRQRDWEREWDDLARKRTK